MSKQSDRSPREIQLKTRLMEEEYAAVKVRYAESSHSSWSAFLRDCLLGKRQRPLTSIEIGQTYNVLGAQERSLLQILAVLEEIKGGLDFVAPELITQIEALTITTATLLKTTQEVQQRLVSLP